MMALRYVKKSTSFHREKNPRKSMYFMESTVLVTPAKRLVAHTSARFEIRGRFLWYFPCTGLLMHIFENPSVC